MGIESAVKVSILGAGGEVGKSAILVDTGDSRVLLDYGVMFNEKVEFPAHVRPKMLNAVGLTHAHLDHSGALPMLYGSAVTPPLYTTVLTLELSALLITDFINLSRDPLPYEIRELELMTSKTKPVSLRDEVKVSDNVYLATYDAGHIPGSVMFEVRANGKRILYTGDFNTVQTRLLRGADRPEPGFDLVISESTYAGVEHPPRKEEEKRFLESVYTVVENGGVVLVPAFAVGRSQEVLCILESHDFPYPVYLDGMAREVSKIMLQFPGFFYDYTVLKEAVERAKFVTSSRQRKRIIKRPGVIVSPAGMLKGGPATFYMDKLAFSEKNGIFLVSYQVPGTPGEKLLSRGVWGENEAPVSAQVEWFDLSSHSGHSSMVKFIEELEPKKVLLVHGESGKAELLAKDLNNLGIDAIIGRDGDTIKV